MFYANGWAQMEAQANLLLHLYGESRGRGAEYWGTSALALGAEPRTETPAAPAAPPKPAVVYFGSVPHQNCLGSGFAVGQIRLSVSPS